jgi:hypothetical protein
MTKDEQREEIARLTQEYLDRGGVIEVIPPRTFLPACYRWMLKYGWSYTPWNHMGGLGQGYGIQDQMAIEEGCYFRQSAPFEGSEDS